MRIFSFETLPSTQRWLVDKVASGEVTPPSAVIAGVQTDGIGSRDNRWIGEEGNFFASVALPKSSLPDDLPPTASSIYFACTMRRVLRAMGSKVWVKWPNDFYLDAKKVGGCITHLKGEAVVAGIGLNLRSAPRDFGVLDIDAVPRELLERWLGVLDSPPSWKQIFSNFRLEFDKSRAFQTHVGDEQADLRGAVLQSDGSLMIGKRRVVSVR